MNPSSSPWKNRIRKLARAVRRSLHPISDQKLQGALDSLGTDGNAAALLVHSSLSHCGALRGGPETLLRSLTSRYANVAVPTHTQPLPKNPGDPIPIFDRDHTPSTVGLFSDYVRTRPGAHRSIHPSHSVAVLGPVGEMLCEGHEYSDRPCGPDTPYHALVDLSAAVLMYGVPLTYYTLFHTAEDAADVPYLYFPERTPMRLRNEIGEVITIQSWRQDWTKPRRFAEMEPELEAAGLLKRTPLGRGFLLFIPDAQAVHEYTVSKLKETPNYLLEAV